MVTIAAHEIERIPYVVVFSEQAAFSDVYGGTGSTVVLQAQLVRPVDHPSERVIVMMHPTGGGAHLPLVAAMARAGHHVIWCDSRYRTDHALIMEKVVIDLGACVRDARRRLGYRHVVLGGWSGGGSLSAFYQEQATAPSVTATPAGAPPDLTAAGLEPADAVMFLAAHISRHGTLTEWLDASVLDEADPGRRDPHLDLYDPANPDQPPYDDAFLARYRAAQLARNRRITAWVWDRLGVLRDGGRPDEELGFVVHGTMADPRWLDPAVDPNQRRPGWCYLGDPRLVNNGPVGLARFSTLRSWLSQWSYDDANGDALRAGAHIAVPTLVIGNLADDACTPSHTHRLYEAVARTDRELHEIDGATHYYAGPEQREQRATAVAIISDWLGRKLGDD